MLFKSISSRNPNSNLKLKREISMLYVSTTVQICISVWWRRFLLFLFYALALGLSFSLFCLILSWATNDIMSANKAKIIRRLSLIRFQHQSVLCEILCHANTISCMLWYGVINITCTQLNWKSCPNPKPCAQSSRCSKRMKERIEESKKDSSLVIQLLEKGAHTHIHTGKIT